MLPFVGAWKQTFKGMKSAIVDAGTKVFGDVVLLRDRTPFSFLI